jgi:hypothetical protein
MAVGKQVAANAPFRPIRTAVVPMIASVVSHAAIGAAAGGAAAEIENYYRWPVRACLDLSAIKRRMP